MQCVAGSLWSRKRIAPSARQRCNHYPKRLQPSRKEGVYKNLPLFPIGGAPCRVGIVVVCVGHKIESLWLRGPIEELVGHLRRHDAVALSLKQKKRALQPVDLFQVVAARGDSPPTKQSKGKGPVMPAHAGHRGEGRFQHEAGWRFFQGQLQGHRRSQRTPEVYHLPRRPTFFFAQAIAPRISR